VATARQRTWLDRDVTWQATSWRNDGVQQRFGRGDPAMNVDDSIAYGQYRGRGDNGKA